jgi:hypothetical protein
VALTSSVRGGARPGCPSHPTRGESRREKAGADDASTSFIVSRATNRRTTAALSLCVGRRGRRRDWERAQELWRALAAVARGCGGFASLFGDGGGSVQLTASEFLPLPARISSSTFEWLLTLRPQPAQPSRTPPRSPQSASHVAPQGRTPTPRCLPSCSVTSAERRPWRAERRRRLRRICRSR